MSDGQLMIPGTEPEPQPDKLKSWALVELFGHQRIVGYVSEQAFGTGVLFRVDVPDLTSSGKVIRAGFTRYFGLSAIYSITPCTEEQVRTMLPNCSGVPADVRPLSSRSYSHNYDDNEDDE
jgi:hypothetical protein